MGRNQVLQQMLLAKIVVQLKWNHHQNIIIEGIKINDRI